MNLYNFGIHDCGSACVQSDRNLDKRSRFIVVETGTGTLIVLQRRDCNVSGRLCRRVKLVKVIKKRGAGAVKVNSS